MSPDVGFIDDRVAPRQPQPLVGSPVVIACHPHAGQEAVLLVHCAAVGIEQQRLAAVVLYFAGGHGKGQGLLAGRRPETITGSVRQVLDDAVVDAVGDVGQRLGPPLPARGGVHDLQAGYARRIAGNVGPPCVAAPVPSTSARGTLTPSGTAVEASMVEAVSKSGMTMTAPTLWRAAGRPHTGRCPRPWRRSVTPLRNRWGWRRSGRSSRGPGG